MDEFVARYRSVVTSVLNGFDRIVFRGTLIPLVMENGMYTFLLRAGVRLLDFKKFVSSTSDRVKEACLAEARENDRPIRFLQQSSLSKEDLARRILAERPVEDGLICTFTAIEPCMSFEYHRSPIRSEQGLKLRPRKCLHIYKYYRHPRFGFMNARIQTWFPFNVQICMNGREWLGRRFERMGYTDFRRHDNCFQRIGDPKLAQRLMNEQLTTDWPRALDSIVHALNPAHRAIFKPSPMNYYWSGYQTEWATDLLFKDPASLAEVYPALVRHAITNFRSHDVMRFLGKRATGAFLGPLDSRFRDRPEGVRVKHYAKGNSIKMYDKAGSVLRIETTIANPKFFRVFRPLQNDPKERLRWAEMRKGVADMHRRAQVSQRANDNYLQALAAALNRTPLSDVVDRVSSPARYRGGRRRAIRIGDAEDLALLKAVSRAEFVPAGFRNRDIRQILMPRAANTPEERRRAAARVSRLLALLRAHGLIHKLPRSHAYRLTKRGQLLTAAIFAARAATIEELVGKAA